MIAAAVGEAIIGWLAADFVSGILHWVYDRVWWPDRSGRVLEVALTQGHHNEPLKFLDVGFIGRNLPSMIIAPLIALAMSRLIGWSLGLVVFTFGGMFWNEVHAWAHAPTRAPRWVRLLQETGLFQPAKQHAAHHRPPQARNYCMLSGWLNPVLEAIDLWAHLERVTPRKTDRRTAR